MLVTRGGHVWLREIEHAGCLRGAVGRPRSRWRSRVPRVRSGRCGVPGHRRKPGLGHKHQRPRRAVHRAVRTGAAGGVRGVMRGRAGPQGEVLGIGSGSTPPAREAAGLEWGGSRASPSHPSPHDATHYALKLPARGDSRMGNLTIRQPGRRRHRPGSRRGQRRISARSRGKCATCSCAKCPTTVRTAEFLARADALAATTTDREQTDSAILIAGGSHPVRVTVDASVAVKWFVAEDHRHEARSSSWGRGSNGMRRICCRCEWANTIWKKARSEVRSNRPRRF